MLSRLLRNQLLLSGLIAAALGLVILGFMSAQTGDADVRFSDPAIERVTPKPATLVLRQSQVGIDLAPGYEGRLTIDQVAIPLDQSSVDAAQNTVYFSPRPGADIEEFTPGPHSITACYWKIADRDTVSTDARCVNGATFTWSFKVS